MFHHIFYYLGLGFLTACFLLPVTYARECTEAEVMSTVLDKDMLDMWWRVRTRTTTREDKLTALKLLRQHKLIAGTYPVEADWYYLRGIMPLEDENYPKLALAGLMFRVLGLMPNRSGEPHCSREDEKIANLISAYNFQGSRGFNYGDVEFTPYSVKDSSSSTRMHVALRFIETGHKLFISESPIFSREELDAIIDSARGPESIYLLLYPQGFGAHQAPSNWREKAEKLVSRGVPVHVGTNLRDIVRDSCSGPYRRGYIPEIASRRSMVNSLFRNCGGYVYGEEDCMDRYDCDNFYILPYSMSPFYLPEGDCVIDTPLLQALYEDKKLDIETKIQMMEFLLQHGTPPYLGVGVFEKGIMVLNDSSSLLSEDVLIPELLLNYGGFCQLNNSKQYDALFLVRLINNQHGDDREHSMKLLLAMLEHPNFNHKTNNVPVIVAELLPEDDAIRFMNRYIQLYSDSIFLRHALDVARTRRVDQTRKMDRLISLLESVAR